MAKISERVSLSCSLVDVVEILTIDPSSWIEPFFKVASFEGRRVGDELRLSKGMTPPQREDHMILIDFDEAEQILGGAIVMPFRWRAVGIPALFTSFVGRFVVWASSPDETTLMVEGDTDALSAAEQASEDVRAAASAALRSLVHNLRAALEESLGPRSNAS